MAILMQNWEQTRGAKFQHNSRQANHAFSRRLKFFKPPEIPAVQFLKRPSKSAQTIAFNVWIKLPVTWPALTHDCQSPPLTINWNLRYKAGLIEACRLRDARAIALKASCPLSRGEIKVKSKARDFSLHKLLALTFWGRFYASLISVFFVFLTPRYRFLPSTDKHSYWN